MSAEPSAARVDVVGAVRAALWTALLACGLFLPLIAFVTDQDINRQLVLHTRFGLFSAFVAILAGGRLVYSLVIAPLVGRIAQRHTPAAPSALGRALAKGLHRLGSAS
jgi:hypothetical protein